MTGLRGVAALVLAATAAFTAAAAPAPDPGATTVILVRHAEKVSKNRYASLSSLGWRRAEALVSELAPLRPAALYSSDLKRAQQTLSPLAAVAGLPLLVRPYGDESALGPEILARHRGRTVVVCGHSGTLSRIAKGIGYNGEFPDVRDFDRIWTLTIPSDGLPVSLAETRQHFAP